MCVCVCVCEQLTQGCYLTVVRARVNPGTFRSPVLLITVTLPSRTRKPIADYNLPVPVLPCSHISTHNTFSVFNFYSLSPGSQKILRICVCGLTRTQSAHLCSLAVAAVLKTVSVSYNLFHYYHTPALL